MIVFELGLENVFSLGVQVGSRTGGWGPDLLELLCIGLFISFVDIIAHQICPRFHSFGRIFLN